IETSMQLISRSWTAGSIIRPDALDTPNAILFHHVSTQASNGSGVSLRFFPRATQYERDQNADDVEAGQRSGRLTRYRVSPTIEPCVRIFRIRLFGKKSSGRVRPADGFRPQHKRLYYVTSHRNNRADTGATPLV